MPLRTRHACCWRCKQCCSHLLQVVLIVRGAVNLLNHAGRASLTQAGPPLRQPGAAEGRAAGNSWLVTAAGRRRAGLGGLQRVAAGPSLACRCRRLRNLACVRRHGGPAGGRRRRCRQHPGAFGRDIKRIALPWRPQGGSNALTRRWAPLEGCERGRRGCRPGCSTGRAIRVPGMCDRAWSASLDDSRRAGGA